MRRPGTRPKRIADADGDEDGPAEGSAVDVQRAEEGERDGALMGEPLHESEGEQEAEDCACAGEDQAFSEQLAHDASAAGAESAAHGEFLGAGGGAGEQQVGEIDAGDEQDGADGGPEDDQRPAQFAADVVLERDGNDAAFDSMLGIEPQDCGYLLFQHMEGATRSASSRACAREMPGLRRPIMVMMLPQSRGGP